MHNNFTIKVFGKSLELKATGEVCIIYCAIFPAVYLSTFELDQNGMMIDEQYFLE